MPPEMRPKYEGNGAKTGRRLAQLGRWTAWGAGWGAGCLTGELFLGPTFGTDYFWRGGCFRKGTIFGGDCFWGGTVFGGCFLGLDLFFSFGSIGSVLWRGAEGPVFSGLGPSMGLGHWCCNSPTCHPLP